jgi:hypothetical protein
VGKSSHTPLKLEHVTGQATMRHAQLLVYGFGPGADFEGRLPGVLERIESGGTVRVVDALSVANDPEPTSSWTPRDSLSSRRLWWPPQSAPAISTERG